MSLEDISMARLTRRRMFARLRKQYRNRGTESGFRVTGDSNMTVRSIGTTWTITEYSGLTKSLLYDILIPSNLPITSFQKVVEQTERYLGSRAFHLAMMHSQTKPPRVMELTRIR